MSIDHCTTTVLPGDGIVHRGPGLALVVDTAAHPRTAELLLACSSTAGDPTGRATVLAVAAMISRHRLPAFGLGLDTDRGLVVLLHDEVEAEIRTVDEGSVVLRGTDSLAWVERRFGGPVLGLHLWTRNTDHPGTGPVAMERAAEGIALDLSRGTLHGAGLLITAHGSEHHDPAGTSITAERQIPEVPTGLPDRSYGSALPATPHQGQPQPQRTPGGGVAIPRPVVPPIEGVLCARGHFTDPQATYCAICGISMQQMSRQITRRPRPPLGVLVLDDGTSVTIDSDLIIGRDPASHPAVTSGHARPLFLNDDVDGVSRVHARITLVDWSVCLTDEDSANGTYLGPAHGAVRTVPGEEPVELTSGTVVRIGRRTLTFDAYHSAGE